MQTTIHDDSIIISDIESADFRYNVKSIENSIANTIYRNKSKIVEVSIDIEEFNSNPYMKTKHLRLNEMIENLINELSNLKVKDIVLIITIAEIAVLEIDVLSVVNKNDVCSKIVLDFSNVYHKLKINQLEITDTSANKNKCKVILSNTGNNIITNLICNKTDMFLPDENIDISKLTLNQSDITLMNSKCVGSAVKDTSSNINSIIKLNNTIEGSSVSLDELNDGFIVVYNIDNKYTLSSIDILPFDTKGKVLRILTTISEDIRIQSILNLTDRKAYNHILKGGIVITPWFETNT